MQWPVRSIRHDDCVMDVGATCTFGNWVTDAQAELPLGPDGSSCEAVACTDDVCPDGKGRREIDGKCCQCPASVATTTASPHTPGLCSSKAWHTCNVMKACPGSEMVCSSSGDPHMNML